MKDMVSVSKLQAKVHDYFEKDDTYYATESTVMDIIDSLAEEPVEEPKPEGSIEELGKVLEDFESSLPRNIQYREWYNNRKAAADKARTELAALMEERRALKYELQTAKEHIKFCHEMINKRDEQARRSEG